MLVSVDRLELAPVPEVGPGERVQASQVLLGDGVAQHDRFVADDYRALRTVNPSPYMFYLDFGDHHPTDLRIRYVAAVAAGR